MSAVAFSATVQVSLFLDNDPLAQARSHFVSINWYLQFIRRRYKKNASDLNIRRGEKTSLGLLMRSKITMHLVCLQNTNLSDFPDKRCTYSLWERGTDKTNLQSMNDCALLDKSTIHLKTTL